MLSCSVRVCREELRKHVAREENTRNAASQRLEHARPLALLHVISLAQFAAACTQGWAANSINARIRLKAELDRAHQEITLLCEKLRIKDARMARIDAHRRPHYTPTERLAILELRAARRWSVQ
jgi:hypothetical protein